MALNKCLLKNFKSILCAEFGAGSVHDADMDRYQTKIYREWHQLKHKQAVETSNEEYEKEEDRFRLWLRLWR